MKLQYNPLVIACQKNDLDLLQKLVGYNRFSLTDVDEEGNTLLHLAVLNNNEPMVKYLLEKQVDAKAVNNMGQTPAHIAAVHEFTNILELLKPVSELTLKDKLGRSVNYYLGLEKFTYVNPKIVTQYHPDVKVKTFKVGPGKKKKAPKKKKAGAK